MERLIAKRPILYMGRTYETGDVIPASDQKMVEAWLNAGTAARQEPAQRAARTAAAKVKHGGPR